MSINRKFIKSGNSWALLINSTILGLLDINPEINLAKYTIDKDKLIITKSDLKADENN